MYLTFDVKMGDFSNAGKVSSEIKGILKQLNINPKDIKRIIVALYEAEVNVVAHSYGGKIECLIDSDRVIANIADTGPGIADIDLAMKEGYSTATEEVREMGFGAGMGLANIKKNSDEMNIESELGKSTNIKLIFYLD
ncbi:MAG: ATP-binding protein [Sphaerochaetaceae bacterium]|jgi:serine/threonine-protein kinase RsbT